MIIVQNIVSSTVSIIKDHHTLFIVFNNCVTILTKQPINKYFFHEFCYCHNPSMTASNNSLEFQNCL